MARANNGGWDFIKVGGTYQYKEDWFIAMVTILEDNSTENEYRFKLQTEQSNEEPPTEDGMEEGVFTISHIKKVGGYYSGMLQFYKEEEYTFNPKWKREVKTV